MGTSTSSRGPGPNVPLVPDWVPSVETPEVSPPADTPHLGDLPADDIPLPPRPLPIPPEMAPPRRFAAARTSLGRYAKSGSSDDLQRGLGHYSRTSMGGIRNASRRMAGTAKTAGGLYSVLDALSTGTPLPSNIRLDPTRLAGRSQREIADIITDTLRPINGTQDTDAARDSVSRAFSELMAKDPDANIQALTPLQIDQVVEAYIANDLATRIDLDVGKAILNKAPTASEGVKRLEQMKSYIRQEVARSFRAREGKGEHMNRQNAVELTSAVLRDTFEVFESYL